MGHLPKLSTAWDRMGCFQKFFVPWDGTLSKNFFPSDPMGQNFVENRPMGRMGWDYPIPCGALLATVISSMIKADVFHLFLYIFRFPVILAIEGLYSYIYHSVAILLHSDQSVSIVCIL